MCDASLDLATERKRLHINAVTAACVTSMLHSFNKTPMLHFISKRNFLVTTEMHFKKKTKEIH